MHKTKVSRPIPYEVVALMGPPSAESLQYSDALMQTCHELRSSTIMFGMDIYENAPIYLQGSYFNLCKKPPINFSENVERIHINPFKTWVHPSKHKTEMKIKICDPENRSTPNCCQ